MHSKKILSLFVLVLVIFILSGCVSLAEDITPPPGYQAPTALQSTPTSEAPIYPMLPPDPVRGEPLYLEKCAPCHGDTGLGNGPDAEMLSNPVAPLGDPDLARLAAPADWYSMVTNGNLQNFMPPFASLSVPERWDVIAYAYTLSTTTDEISRGQELYREDCAACHGVRGEGDGPDAGSLSASPVDFTDQAFMGTRSAADLFQSITDGLGEMHSYASISEDDRWAITAFLRTLTFEEATLEATQESGLLETPVGEAEPEVTQDTQEDLSDTTDTDKPDVMAGTVTIEVVTVSGNPLPDDLEVNLYGYENMVEVYSSTLTLSNDGTAVAEDVPMITGQYIFATTDSDGIMFGSDIATVDSEMSSIQLTIPYYEPTKDLSVLRAERLHIFFEFVDEETIQVYVLYIFSNTSDKVLAADNANEPVLVFNLPEGAANLQRETGMEFQDVDLPNGFGLLTVYPSNEQYQVLYSFELPYEKNSVDIDLPIGLDTSAVIVMIPEGGPEVESDRLVDAGMRDIEGVSYSMYNGSNLSAGDSLNMAVSGKPKFQAVPGENITSGDTTTGLVIGLAAFGVVLVGAGAYLWMRNRAKNEDLEFSEGMLGSDLPDQEDPDDLMDAIITLDELFQAGEIPEEAYLIRRAELKRKLQELIG
jgi:mono/diheme cytochrome c family protein